MDLGHRQGVRFRGGILGSTSNCTFWDVLAQAQNEAIRCASRDPSVLSKHLMSSVFGFQKIRKPLQISKTHQAHPPAQNFASRSRLAISFKVGVDVALRPSTQHSRVNRRNWTSNKQPHRSTHKMKEIDPLGEG